MKKHVLDIPEIEKASPEVIKRFQEERLKELLIYLKQNSPFYQRLFKQHNIDIQTIQTLEDLQQIPTTNKENLQQFNNDFICVERNQIIDYVTTSGTLGSPVTFALTDKDLDRLAYNEAISFACAGITSDDVIQLTTTIDRRFMAGLAYFLGARKLGAGIVRVGSGLPELQWDTIQRVQPTVLIAVPSFILKLVEYAKKNGIDYKNSSIRSALCIGEPLRNLSGENNPLGQKIKALWDIDLYSTYASTEMSTAFTECEYAVGGHHHPELIIVELLNDKDELCQENEAGEVVVTTLGVEAMPLLRFRTGDICTWQQDACACGRNTLRLSSVIGRKKQMIKYKGTSLYPPALYDILHDFSNIRAYMIEVSTNTIGTDEITIYLNTENNSTEIEKEIKDHFRAKLRVAPNIIFLPFAEIRAMNFPKMSRKPIKFIDKRTK